MTQSSVTLEQAKALVLALEAGDDATVANLVDEISALRESELYLQLNKLTENLHQTLDELDDHSLLMQTKHDIPDATERLEYVIETTEQASRETLDRVEQVLQNLDKLENAVGELSEDAQVAMAAAKEKLTDIMLAQSFQDLTGQVLNRVIFVISSLEQSLIQLIENSAYDYHAIPERALTDEETHAENMQGVGPNVTKKSKTDSVASQDDVDSLLDELGL